MNPHAFTATQLTTEDRYIPLSNPKSFGQILNQLGIRSSFDRRGSDPYFKTLSLQSHNFITRCLRLQPAS